MSHVKLSKLSYHLQQQQQQFQSLKVNLEKELLKSGSVYDCQAAIIQKVNFFLVSWIDANTHSITVLNQKNDNRVGNKNKRAKIDPNRVYRLKDRKDKNRP